MRYRLLAILLAVPCPVAGQQDYVDADVHFMQGMIHHHAQALRMVTLVPDRTERRDLRLLGQRIAISQRDEIGLMQRWLEDHGQAAPRLDVHDQVVMADMPGMASDTIMPGMLTDEQMARLAQAKGPAFDRLFLEGMIHHHEGALTMVDQLFHARGGGQASDVFRFASDVNADQRAEIARMQTMLQTPLGGRSNP
jgi:uncharacterized protein (DUF305 family)